MAYVPNLANLDVITEAFVDSVKDGLNTGVYSGTYTPTLSGMAVGTGGSASNSAQYNFVGGVLMIQGQIIFGTTAPTFPGATITASLPTGFTWSGLIGAATTFPLGAALMTVGATSYDGMSWVGGSSTVRFLAKGSAGANVNIAATSTTVPGTWAAGDVIRWTAIGQATFA